MRYIEKTNSPTFFEQEKQNLIDDSAWKNLYCKNELRSYLIEEQKQLCAYCERRIDGNNSHIEHIYPQSDNVTLRFEYDNLIASCNGDQCEPSLKDDFQPEDINSCGHKKSNKMDDDIFLNPVKQKDIQEYFSYDKETCAICSSEKNLENATYTIKLLGLDNPRLNLERSNARIALEQAIKRYLNSSPKEYKNKIRILLSKERPFISFLRYYYSPFLK
jgi:uncharacterized protein (TIGR02646 family)